MKSFAFAAPAVAKRYPGHGKETVVAWSYVPDHAVVGKGADALLSVLLSFKTARGSDGGQAQFCR